MNDRPWLGLRHLALRVHKWDACRRFYLEFLGFEVEWEPDPDNLYLTSGQDNLALHRAESPPLPEEDSRGRLDHMGFVVTEANEVDRWFARAEESGVTIKQAIKTHRDGARSFYCADPDGNVIQILHHPPLEKLPGGSSPIGRG